MPITLRPKLLTEFSSERDGPDGQILTRVYEIAPRDTLADVSLERGDSLPEDATAEILSAEWMPVEKVGKGRKVKVSAIKWRGWVD